MRARGLPCAPLINGPPGKARQLAPALCLSKCRRTIPTTAGIIPPPDCSHPKSKMHPGKRSPNHHHQARHPRSRSLSRARPHKNKKTPAKGVSELPIYKKEEVGSGLLSHGVAPALPSTLVDFTTGFEMGPGVSPPLLPPTPLYLRRVKFASGLAAHAVMRMLVMRHCRYDAALRRCRCAHDDATRVAH